MFSWPPTAPRHCSAGPPARARAARPTSSNRWAGGPAQTFTLLLGTAELAGGLALAFRAGTPIAAGVIIAVLANAASTVHRPHGLWNTAGGYEYPLVLAGFALALAVPGPGRISIDHIAGWHPSPLLAAVLALGIGLVGWLVGDTARGADLAGLFQQPPRGLRPST